MTPDTWHVTGGWGWTLSQNFSFLALTSLDVMMFWRFGGQGWINESLNDKGVCRTALATPGLLIINRLCVARVVLQTTSQLPDCTDPFSHLFPPNLVVYATRFLRLNSCHLCHLRGVYLHRAGDTKSCQLNHEH